MRFSRWVFGGLVALGLSGIARADTITSAAGFGPTAVVESFENIAPRGQNLALGTSYTFPTGSTLTVSSSQGTFGPYVVNGGFYGLYGADPRVPNGTAYLGQANPGLFDTGISITFPTEQSAVGAYIAVSDPTEANDPAPLYLAALNDAGATVASTIIRNYTVANWANDFIGFANVGPIRTFYLDGFGDGVLRLDDLTSQSVAAPLPAAWSGAALLLAVAAGWRWTRSWASA